MLYLFLKLPFSIVMFTIAVTLISVNLSLLTAPIYYSFLNMDLGFWHIDKLWEAFVLILIGIPMVFLHIAEPGEWYSVCVRSVGTGDAGEATITNKNCPFFK